MISGSGTLGGTADWIVNDLRINNRSQFVQGGGIPGDLFAANAIDAFVRFDMVDVNAELSITVTYIGLNSTGAVFTGVLVGNTLLDERTLMYLVLDEHLWRVEIVKSGPSVVAHAVLDLGPCTSRSKKLRVSEQLAEFRRIPAKHGFGLYGVNEKNGLAIMQLGTDAKGKFMLDWSKAGWQPDWLQAA